MFGLLESALRRSFPDLPQGFTWREGLSRAKALGLDLQWNDMSASSNSRDTTAYRYGTASIPEAQQPELMKLVNHFGGHRNGA